MRGEYPMGDFHFIVRHALTGVILLVFVLIGVYITDETLWELSLDRLSQNLKDVSSLVPLVVTAPVIGIAIQGVYVAYLHVRRAAFTDPARRQVADRIKTMPTELKKFGMTDQVASMYDESFASAPIDPLFVWLYHTEAEAHLIEWARRRRSYHYLGVSWAIAAILGLVIGALMSLIFHLNSHQTLNRYYVIAFLIIFSAAWTSGTLWMAKVMKRDVDVMELTWSCASLYPKFKELISKQDDKSAE